MPEEKGAFKEPEIVLPASSLPAAANLVEFDKMPRRSFRYYIDPATLWVEQKENLVRYVLVARSGSGVLNVSYEGLRCADGRHRIYAVGQPDGSWSRRGTEWQDVKRAGAQGVRLELHRDYFCPDSIAIPNVAEGTDALKRGGNSRARQDPGLMTPGE